MKKRNIILYLLNQNKHDKARNIFLIKYKYESNKIICTFNKGFVTFYVYDQFNIVAKNITFFNELKEFAEEIASQAKEIEEKFYNEINNSFTNHSFLSWKGIKFDFKISQLKRIAKKYPEEFSGLLRLHFCNSI